MSDDYTQGYLDALVAVHSGDIEDLDAEIEIIEAKMK